MRFAGRVVIVTGSSRGIGKAIALAFAREGAKVVITSRNGKDCDRVAREINNSGSACLSVACDVSRARDVDNLVRQTIKKFGRIDVVVNNAGVYKTTPISTATEADWDYNIDINLKGPFLLCRAAVPHLKKGSSIVNIASVIGEVGVAGAAAYCASKGGLITFTKALALELASRGIRVNAVCPGPIQTAMLGNLTRSEQKWFLDRVPLRRIGKPEEVAKAVLFLAGDATFTTGSCVFVDGGWIAQ